MLPLLLALACTSPSDTADTADPHGFDPDAHGALTQVDGMDVLYLWGTRAELGHAEGSLLCGKITRLYQAYFIDEMLAPSGYPYELVLAEARLRSVLPEGDAAELQGIIDGMSAECPAEELLLTGDYVGGERPLSYDDLFIAHTLPDWACSSFTAWGEATTTGSTVHARNLDYFVDDEGVFLDEHLVKLYHSTEEGGARWASVSVPGLVGCISCFTEDGVGLTMHDSNGLASSQDEFTPRVLAARAALSATSGQADPVPVAEAILEIHGQDMGNNLHLSFPCLGAGCTGGAVLEYDGDATHEDGRVTVRGPGLEGYATQDATVCTNHFVDRRPPPTGGDSWRRLTTLAAGVDEAASAGGLEPDSARDLIAEVAHGATVHTVIMDPAAMELSLYVSPEPGTPAPEAEPAVMNLDEIFSKLP